MRLRLRGLSAKFAVILSGELVQSLFHFGVNIALVRSLVAYDYGLFAIVFTVGGIGITYIRSLVAVPATLFLARSLGRLAERGHDVTFGAAATLVALGLGGIVTLGLLPTLGLGALTGGAFVALYTFRAYLRIVLLARAASRIAGFSDIAYAGSGTLFGALLLHGDGTLLLDHAFIALALAHATGIAVAYAALRQPVRLRFRPSLRRRYAAIWPTLVWSLVGITSTNIQGQGLTLLFALIAGPAAYAPIAATLVLFAPLRIPTNALTNMVLPEITGLLAGNRLEPARRLVTRSTAIIAAGCLVYGAAMWVGLPIIEHHLFKGRFLHEPMELIGLGVWSVVTVSLLYAIPRAFLEAAAAFRDIAYGATVAAVIGFVVMVPVLLTVSPPWALAGLLASEAATALWCWRCFGRRSRGDDPASDTSDAFVAGLPARS
ncbi:MULTISPECIES: hypothetical protein [Methylobacterium]|uniref:Membrane protein involved in the export of O-antigen and teichoic acid n=5 Tax=Pseudomonadota TaxID=1224 RepID=A0ABQ4SUL0_9HYPH|nr:MULTISPECIES: hypothetical protein [Methylobacterium]PIU08255.1 MAG: hypothetical protein COT56_01985 [Methylobacterium sp. CG09_land_8_20_14_0_10_71_15]PIU12892.1 MAG: hypothetical protein COT28_13760 [Methylobacterium sp. CG08_land_8_20_14_0_20_71_15]GBU17513.1 hypothetical protein AwMethylo_17280 [Methylobacterium sp.]GJE06160.1 hypothetical protein AOPFMNJM_1473 [Methylobacterium jeotgali]